MIQIIKNKNNDTPINIIRPIYDTDYYLYTHNFPTNSRYSFNPWIHNIEMIKIFNNIPNGNYWLIVPYCYSNSENMKRTFKNSKLYILQNKNFKVLYKWQAPEDDNIYIINFEKSN